MAAMQLAYAVGRRGNVTICAGLPPQAATFPLPSAAMVADERVIKGSYMGSAIPLYAEAFASGRLPVDRLLTGEIDFENLNRGFDDLDDGVGVRQILNCGL